MINSAKPTDAGVERAWATFSTWLFRECNEGTRRHLWAMFELPVDEIRNHGIERHALKLVRRALSTPQPAEDISDTLIERVARAISDANWRDEATKEFLDERWADELLQGVARKQARAALAAMGE